MINFEPVILHCGTISEAWVRLLYNCIARGRTYLIEEGSRAGQHRLTMDFAIVFIKYPEIRPFVPQTQPGQILPYSEEQIDDYFQRYVYSPLPPEPNEHYNYSEYLYPLANSIIKYYSTKGFGNAHPVMRVGDPFCFLDYFEPYDNEAKRKTTPCLKSINPKIIDSHMMFHVDYRSWDCFSGYPCNIGGFQLLKELMCQEISSSGTDVFPGPTVTTCVDLHIYEEDLLAAATWTGQDVSDIITKMKRARGIK